jgi:hypothetical protein
MRYLTEICLLGFICSGFVLAREISYPDWPKAVADDGMNPLYAAVEQHSRFTSEVSAEIIRSISDTDDNLKKSKGFFVLGEVPCLASVSFLLKNIDFVKHDDRMHSEIPLIRTYPAQEALKKIGPKALPALLDVVAKETDSAKYPFYFNVIYDIFQVGDIQKSTAIFQIVMSDCTAEVKDKERADKIREAIRSFINSKLDVLKRSREAAETIVPEN